MIDLCPFHYGNQTLELHETSVLSSAEVVWPSQSKWFICAQHRTSNQRNVVSLMMEELGYLAPEQYFLFMFTTIPVFPFYVVVVVVVILCCRCCFSVVVVVFVVFRVAVVSVFTVVVVVVVVCVDVVLVVVAGGLPLLLWLLMQSSVSTLKILISDVCFS